MVVFLIGVFFYQRYQENESKRKKQLEERINTGSPKINILPTDYMLQSADSAFLNEMKDVLEPPFESPPPPPPENIKNPGELRVDSIMLSLPPIENVREEIEDYLNNPFRRNRNLLIEDSSKQKKQTFKKNSE